MLILESEGDNILKYSNINVLENLIRNLLSALE